MLKLDTQPIVYLILTACNFRSYHSKAGKNTSHVSVRNEFFDLLHDIQNDLNREKEPWKCPRANQDTGTGPISIHDCFLCIEKTV